MTSEEIAASKKIASIIRYGKKGESLALKLARQGVRTRADLKKPQIFSILPRESQSNVMYNPVRSFSLSVAKEIIKSITPRAIPVGSVRRERSTIKDLDFLIVSDGSEFNPCKTCLVLDNYVSGKYRKSYIIKHKNKNYKCDFFFTTPVEKPYALFHYTGSKQYNIRIRAYAKKKGWLLNQHGIFNRSGKRVSGTEAIKTERDIANFLGVTFRPPTDREK